MAVKVITKTKTIINTPKMDRELKELPLSGPKYIQHFIKADKIDLYYTEMLDQTEIDEAENYLNNFVETSAFDTELSRVRGSMNTGFDLYQRIFTDISLKGGLHPELDGNGDPQPFLDESIRKYTGNADVQTMVVSMESIRCMLKDNMYESTLRAFSVFKDPAHNLDAAQVTLYQGWLEVEITKVDLGFGKTQAEIDGKIAAIKAAPKGGI